MFDKLAALGAEMLVEALELLPQGKLTPVEQDDSLSSYAPMLDKDTANIDWSKSAEQVHDLVRGLYSWPIAQTTLNGKRLKIYRTSLCNKTGDSGAIISLDPLTVACGKGSVIVHELQLEGKKRMDAAAFLVGHRLDTGNMLGD